MDAAGDRRVIGALIGREIRRSIGGAAWLPVAFFLLVATLVPFAVGPDPRLLARIGGGALWIAALTAALLPIERLIEPDRAAGVVDQLRLHGVAEESVAAAKIAGHWLTFAPLLLLASVPGALLLGLRFEILPRILLPLAIGTPALAALAVAVAALTAGLPRAGSLGGLLLLPLAIPLLIFGAAASGDEGSGALLLEAAVSLLITAGAPFIAGAAIRAART
jgi:heme exporter protein B